MAEATITAESLMATSFLQIPGDRALREAVTMLIHLPKGPATPAVLIVMDPAQDGVYLGYLTARLLFKNLLDQWSPTLSEREDRSMSEKELLDVLGARLDTPVGEAVAHGLPTVRRDVRLLNMIESVVRSKLEALPVIEEGAIYGIVTLKSIYLAAAGLALTPETQGIQLPGEGK